MNIPERIKEHLGDKIILWEARSTRRVYITIKKELIVKTVEYLVRQLGLRFSTATAIHTPEGFEILYHFSYDPGGEVYTLRLVLDNKEKPKVDAITPLFPGAEWMEREMWELMGIDFTGHPNLKRLLLADDWPDNDYPLRNR